MQLLVDDRDRNSTRAGFRLVRAYDDCTHVGLPLGYPGESGQMWPDRARSVLTPEIAQAWLGGHFELATRR